MSGKFITFEGGEGAGKSTQTVFLAEILRSAGLAVVTTREPGGAPGAEEIRKILVEGEPGRWDALTETLLHFAARREHLVKTIQPALARDDWVISDRFADSTMAYQGYGLKLGRDTVAALYSQAIGDFRPDLTLILDLPVEIGLDRARRRSGGEDRYENMGVDFHRRLRDGFLEIANREPERCIVIDAEGPPEHVSTAVRAAVGDRLQIEGL